MAGWAKLNRIINTETWLISRETSEALGRLAGQIALYQLKYGRQFLKENPRGSDLYQLPEWLEVKKHPRVKQIYVDMCAAGLRDKQTGLLIREPE